MGADWELLSMGIGLGPLEPAGAKVKTAGILGSGESSRSRRRLWGLAWCREGQALGSLGSSVHSSLLLPWGGRLSPGWAVWDCRGDGGRKGVDLSFLSSSARPFFLLGCNPSPGVLDSCKSTLAYG